MNILQKYKGRGDNVEEINSFKTIDTHTMGEPTRIIIEGLPSISGNSMMDKKNYLVKHLDYIRTMAMHEPRGHKDMFGAVLMNPTKKEADIGVIFMDSGGYLNMCGHGSIGVSTILVNEGYVKVEEPITTIVLDTPAGLVKAKVEVKNKQAIGVSIENVPAFLYKENIKVKLPELGQIPVDISFGGSFFALVDSKDLNLNISLKNIDKLTKIALLIREEINNKVEVIHPNNPSINKVELVEIYDESTNSDADLKNVVIFGNGQFDRSPCGTGTSAKIAYLYGKNKLKKNEPFIYESITGTMFKGRILREEKIGKYNGIVPEIKGRAFITGYSRLIAQREDPFKHGLIL